jgi:hypothetical protein
MALDDKMLIIFKVISNLRKILLDYSENSKKETPGIRYQGTDDEVSSKNLDHDSIYPLKLHNYRIP